MEKYSDIGFPIKITITKKSTTLFAQATGQNAFPPELREIHQFEFNKAGIKLDFQAAEKRIILKQAAREFILSKN